MATLLSNKGVTKRNICARLAATSIIIVNCTHAVAGAAVLEETSAGTFVPLDLVNDGILASAPEISQPEGQDASGPVEAQWMPVPVGGSNSAVVLDTASSLTKPVRVKTVANLPKPRAFASGLSPTQERMRQLTIAVARRFAGTPGVARANLDRQSFVALFTTMIHRESNFNMKAVSPAGAKGLGQLMPGTAKDLGVCDVFSARDNLNGAATYLTMMLNQFGSPSIALAAYNAGPTAVVRHNGIPPFTETRQYVADILHATNRAISAPDKSAGKALAYQSDDVSTHESLDPFAVLFSAGQSGQRCSANREIDVLAKG